MLLFESNLFANLSIFSFTSQNPTSFWDTIAAFRKRDFLILSSCPPLVAIMLDKSIADAVRNAVTARDPTMTGENGNILMI